MSRRKKERTKNGGIENMSQSIIIPTVNYFQTEVFCLLACLLAPVFESQCAPPFPTPAVFEHAVSHPGECVVGKETALRNDAKNFTSVVFFPYINATRGTPSSPPLSFLPLPAYPLSYCRLVPSCAKCWTRPISYSGS